MTLADFRRLRRRVLDAAGSARTVLLRRYLREKARRGIWDPRYCAFFDVSPDVTPKLKKAIMRGFAIGLVPTSTKRSGPASDSWHNARDEKGRGRAVDMGLRPDKAGTAKGRELLVQFQRAEHNRGGWREVIGPDNGLIILRGVRTNLTEGTALEEDHDDHTHLADAS